MKTLKQAAMQFASDLRNNRCFKAAYNDALLELDQGRFKRHCTMHISF